MNEVHRISSPTFLPFVSDLFQSSSDPSASIVRKQMPYFTVDVILLTWVQLSSLSVVRIVINVSSRILPSLHCCRLTQEPVLKQMPFGTPVGDVI